MSAIDPRALRSAFSTFMTGVTVVTSKAADGTAVGFTANSFSSVSLDPPLLLVCPGKFLSSYEAFAGCTQFAVNILAEGQEDVANTFASYKGDRFARVAHYQDALGNLLIDGALAQFSCTTHSVVDAGDHAILIGAVQSFEHDTGRGLGYVGGQFFSLGLERAALEHSGTMTLGGAIITWGDTVLLERTEAGYRPPQCLAKDRDNLRQSLTHDLETRGLPVKLGPAYSVFDDGRTHCSFFLAAEPFTSNGGFESHPIGDISKLKFASQPITDMMNRFALERQTRSFGLYVGDAQRGDVHHLPERN
ncbi:flavin reductase family protein [Pseudophaeobacter flagellatus]|uniref:flavin reductase family protein n=1 Tax=Pseudophaeobacter flagellatus TaxID=2899119 RepID=UPI001E36FABD|nr:flavin reductase family protein [Pseudophaeobacter flagellatus]MCD9147903.1 flavin reductase family protein [Pseudophaeobacter flagellatus]